MAPAPQPSPLPMHLPLLAALLVSPAPRAPFQDGPSGAAINAAIDRGVEFLLRSQNRDGSFGVDLYERGTPWHAFRDGASSLALYTLIHCGVEADHPARQRLVAFLLAEEPAHTYSIGAQLLAFGATGDPAYEERMEELLERLLDLQKSGGWDYPGFVSPPDLSNTQVAVLGLWAAEKAGLRVPRDAWITGVEAAMRCQEPASRPEGADRSVPETAGFFYHVSDRTPTGSRTNAGLSILSLALAEPGRIPSTLAKRAELSRDLGLAWLEAHFDVRGNPGGAGGWHFYYLYALERVGALNHLERIGEHDWYGEGAAELLREQHPSGGWWIDGRSRWPPAPMPIANTCFALLFLRRATFSEPRRGHELSVAVEDPGSDVWFRVTTRRPWALWLTGIPAARERSLAIEAVEWWIDGELVESVPGDPARAWDGERFAVQHEPSAGEHVIECRVRARPLEPVAAAPLELRSKQLTVAGEDVLEPWMLEYATAQARNLLAGEEVEVTASSQESAFHPKEDVLDGLQGSAWLAADDDEAPWLRLEPRRTIRTREILLSPAGASEILRETCATLEKVELRVNGAKDPLTVELDPDPRKKTLVELPRAQRLRELEVRLVAWQRDAKKPVGLAEIELR